MKSTFDQDKFVPFAIPDIGEEEIAEVVDTLRSGWLTTGPKTMRFEEDFASFMGENVEALAVNSATAGLHLALEAAGVGPGHEVITTPYTFTATAEVIQYLGAKPVFVDIREDTLNLDHDQIEAAITERTRGVIPVHFAGLACNMTSILRTAKRHSLKVVEDAAHARDRKLAEARERRKLVRQTQPAGEPAARVRLPRLVRPSTSPPSRRRSPWPRFLPCWSSHRSPAATTSNAAPVPCTALGHAADRSLPICRNRRSSVSSATPTATPWTCGPRPHTRPTSTPPPWICANA